MLAEIWKRRVQVAILVGAILALSMTAEKFRELVGEEDSSKSGKFTFMDCFDMGYGTLTCGVKIGIKQYVYNMRSSHVERVRQRAMEAALTEALGEGLSSSEAAKQAQKVGAKAAKLASRQAKRILGPIISSGWDFFEAVYYGGTMTEGFLRGSGTLFGTYVGGYHGEQTLGKLGYFMGSHLGSWVGGRIGLMVYDVVSGLHYLFLSEGHQSSSSASEWANSEDLYRSEGNTDYESSNRDLSSDDASSSEGIFSNKASDEKSDYYETRNENSEKLEGWNIF